MKLISIGRFTEKLDYKSNLQDYITWKAMSAYFSTIFLVVESPDENDHKEELDGISVYWIKRQGTGFVGRQKFAIRAYRLAKKLIIENEIDVINVGEPVVSGIPAVILRRQLNKPLVTQVQGQLLNIPKGTFNCLKSLYIKRATEFVCKHSNRIRTVSEEIRKEVIALGIDSDIVVTVPPRCDIQKFNPRVYENDRANARSVLGYNDSDIVVVFTGRVVAYRDLESDLKALELVIEEHPQYKLLVVGDGDDRNRLEHMVEEMHLSNNVFFAGRVPFEEIPRYLSISDIFISTPTNEGIARSVLEAMAMELPVVATKVGGTPEAVQSGENGFLVDVESPSQIASALIKLESAEKRKVMGERARRIVIEKYEFAKSIRKFAEMHKGLQ